MNKSRRYTNDRLGQIAQERVGLWLEEADLNKSASNPDRDGWDYHVSFPRPAPLDGSSFFDSDPPRTSLYIQVKGSVVSWRRQRVALSHWTYAATIPMPWFFVVIEFDSPPAPARLFIVHVDANLIAIVMKRLRKEGADVRSIKVPKLHKLMMDLTWTEAHQVPCSAEGLRSALITHAGEDMAAYAERKRHWRENAGNDTVRNKLTLIFTGPRAQSNERIAEWALGRTENLRVDRLHRVEYRWGIARPIDPEMNVLVSFGTPPSIGRTRVRVSNFDETEHAEYEADVYCNIRFASFIPRDLWAIRIVWGFLEMLVKATSPGVVINLHIPENQPAVSLSELATVARAIRLLSRPCKLSYGIPGYNDDRERTHDIMSPPSQPMDDTELLIAIEAAWALCSMFGIPPSFKISPGALDKLAEEITEYHHLLTSNNVTAQLETLDRTDLVEGQDASFLWFPMVRLGDYHLVTALNTEGQVQFVGERGRVVAKPTFLGKWAIDRAKWRIWLRGNLPRLVEGLVSELESKGKRPFVIDKELAATLNALLEKQRRTLDS